MIRTLNGENESELWCANLPFHSLQPIPDTKRKAIVAEARRLCFWGWCLVLFLPVVCVTLLTFTAAGYMNAFLFTLCACLSLLVTPYMIWGLESPLRRGRRLRADLKGGALRQFRGPLCTVPHNYLIWPPVPGRSYGVDGSILRDDPLRRYFEIGESCQNSILVGRHSNRIYYINDEAVAGWIEARVTSRSASLRRRG